MKRNENKIKRSANIFNQSILNCERVSKSFVTTEITINILNEIDLDVNKAESIAIVGQSGSGKTTLLSLLAGLDTPTSGTIKLFQNTLEELNEDERAALRNQYIGFVFQAFHLLPSFSALENVMLPLEINGDDQPEEQARQLLERVGMSHRLNHYPSTLSGGEQQRVAIARAFSTTPPLLLADEPTGNLDAQTGQTIIDLLFELNNEKSTTLILVTHDESLTRRCKRCFRLSDGILKQM